ncbi:MAG TPA: MBL fold metallo-hydrolase [Kofleriaceae bacterium]|nr:MBL fold metallo-hydrolase [Kofleriaceae bacterium]
MTTIEFLGAIDTVTGSKYLVETGGRRVLVECGLFQGPKKLREKNWREPRFDPRALDAVVLTHAHIDHSGYLPRLCKDGFAGPVYCTPATRDLLRLLLPDSGHLQEEEAEHANRGGYAHHAPALPLYTSDDAERCLAQLAPVEIGERFEPATGFAARFSRAGHILGAACVALDAAGTSIAFSGDVGRPNDPIMRPPEPMPAADHLVIESTYGDRRHPDTKVDDELARIIGEACERRGVVVVPAFAVGRAQHLLHILARLRAAGRIPECPIFLDSPMAIDATEIFLAHRDDHALSEAECAAIGRIARYSHTADDSRAIDRGQGPMVVISASGMATGGRVLHHLARFLPDERATILFVGYQAAGTRGRTLIDGAKELKLLGQYVPVRARVAQLDALSAHADYAEMLDWLRASRLSPRRVFVTHGEPSAADAFRRRLHESFGWNACVPDEGVAIPLG